MAKKISNDEINALYREFYSRSFKAFVKDLWNEIEPAKFVDNWHIDLFCEELEKSYKDWDKGEKGRDIIVNCPPGSSKSLIFSVLFPAWVWLVNPKIKFITYSYSQRIAEELSGKFATLIKSDKYKGISNYELIKDSIINIKNNKGGLRFTTSTSGTVTGIHADILIGDDPNSPDSIYSEASRLEAKRFVTEILPSRLTNPSRSYNIYVQQRLHSEDVTGVLLNEKTNHILVPAINSDGESFNPRFSLDFLAKQKVMLGSVSFNAQYMQTVTPFSGGIIKKEWVKEYLTENKELTYFIDTSYGGDKADYNAIIGVYKDNNNLYIHFIEQNKYEFPELLQYLKKNIPNNSKVYIEGKASGKSVIQTLKRETSFNIIELQVKDSKMTRKNAASPFFEASRVFINKASSNKELLIEQLIFDNTKNDDLMDVVLHSIEQLLKVNTKFKMRTF